MPRKNAPSFVLQRKKTFSYSKLYAEYKKLKDESKRANSKLRALEEYVKGTKRQKKQEKLRELRLVEHVDWDELDFPSGVF